LNIRGVDWIPSKSALNSGGMRKDVVLAVVVAPRRQILLYLSQRLWSLIQRDQICRWIRFEQKGNIICRAIPDAHRSITYKRPIRDLKCNFIISPTNRMSR
jgi:hypothetical protein